MAAPGEKTDFPELDDQGPDNDSVAGPFEDGESQSGLGRGVLPVTKSDVVPARTSMVAPGFGEYREATDLDLRDPAVLAHEINNPLGAISAAASGIDLQRVREGASPDDKIRGLTEIIQQSVQQIAGVMKLLAERKPSEFPDPNNIEATPNFRKIDLSRVVNAQVHSWKILEGAAGVSIVEQIEDEVYIRGDGVKLYEILSNVIKNAVEITKRHSQNPEIRVEMRVGRGGLIQILIQDNGPGIRPEDHQRLFQRGFSRKHGHGIGLWRARKLVKEMGGYIDLVNNNDREDLDRTANIPGATAIIELQRFEE